MKTCHVRSKQTHQPHHHNPGPPFLRPLHASPCSVLHIMAQAHSNHRCTDLLLAVAFVASAFLVSAGDASSVGLDLHHRFSPVVRRWAEARGHPFAAQDWPARGTPEYYAALSRHDRALLARRALAGGADGLLTFAAGNDTYQVGSLYYAEVELGTPNATFVVALDTGSDLFWVPCDCKQCASIPNANATGPDAPPPLGPYSPRRSTTSKQVTCASALCGRPNACSAATNGSCPYEVRYVSANTSSSGVLVQDVLHLTKERPGPGAATEALQAPVVFGCGQVQTGLFLDGGGALDGLMGLGRDKVSVPSALAAAGLVASDSFSMCFGDDAVGRLNFGDAGSRGQAETPFTGRSTLYNVSFTSINVETKSVAAEFAAVIDSGTSYTSLTDPEYTELATNFNSQIRERRTNFSSGSADPFPFEYCYTLGPNQTKVLVPDVSLTTKGGARFPVTRPIIGIGDGRTVVGYCLAILKNDIGVNFNVIGQNFMTGLKVVFDRERSVLGWEKFDCYKNARVADAPDGSPSPAPAAGPRPTNITPRQNDGSGSGYPGAAPLPTSAGSRNTAAAGALGLGVAGLYLLAATLV